MHIQIFKVTKVGSVSFGGPLTTGQLSGVLIALNRLS